MTREALLALLGQLSDEERQELGIVDPVAPPALERGDVLILLADLTEEERDGLGIPEGGTPSLVALKDITGDRFEPDLPVTNDMLPKRYSGVAFGGMSRSYRYSAVTVLLRPENVQAGDLLRVLYLVRSFFGWVILVDESIMLEAGQADAQFDVSMFLEVNPNSSQHAVIVGLSNRDGADVFRTATDYYPSPGVGRASFDGEDPYQITDETFEFYADDASPLRLFTLSAESVTKGVVGPVDPVDLDKQTLINAFALYNENDRIEVRGALGIQPSYLYGAGDFVLESEYQFGAVVTYQNSRYAHQYPGYPSQGLIPSENPAVWVFLGSI